MQNSEGHSDRSSKNELLLTEAYNPEAYNSVAKFGVTEGFSTLNEFKAQRELGA